MRITLVLSFVCLLAAAALPAQVPLMMKVEPDSGKIGSLLRIHGNFLDKTKVDEVYLTDHTFDLKVKVLEQTDDSIQFRVPPFVKPGRLQLVVKTTGKDPLVIEQPVYVTIEEPKDQDRATLQAHSTAPPASSDSASSDSSGGAKQTR
jgi:hypothetical protein